MAAGPAVLKAYVSAPVLLAFCILGIVVATVVTAARVYVRLKVHKRLLGDDYFHFAAVAFYYALCGIYIADIPPMYSFLDYTSGYKAFDPSVSVAYTELLTYNFAVVTLFWAVLWAVKLNLLWLFRKLLQDTGKTVWWWIVFVVTILTFIGCIISQYESCSSISAFTKLGQCVSPRDQRAQAISLYMSFGFDVLTEVMVLSIPWQILRTLHKSLADKLRLACLFSVGLITVIVSFIRVFLIFARTGSTTASPAWLALWAIIESMTAIIAGSIPAISQMFRRNRANQRSRESSSSHKTRVQATGPGQSSRSTTGIRSMLSSKKASTGRGDLSVDDDWINLTAVTKETSSLDETSTDGQTKPQAHEQVSIQRQVFLEKQIDKHDKDDDLHRWMLKD